MFVLMSKLSVFAAAIVAGASVANAQVDKFVPVTQTMLENPAPEDWLMYSRTYDAQRFSPLKQITRQNVSQLRTVWTSTTRSSRYSMVGSCSTSPIACVQASARPSVNSAFESQQ